MQTDINERIESVSTLLVHDERDGYVQFYINQADANSDDLFQLWILATKAIRDGYEGISIAYENIGDTRHGYEVLNVDKKTPEGRIFMILKKRYLLGKSLPKYKKLLKKIELEM
jgi:hypothetical protein